MTEGPLVLPLLLAAGNPLAAFLFILLSWAAFVYLRYRPTPRSIRRLFRRRRKPAEPNWPFQV